MNNRYDWDEIQKFYDNKHTWKDISIKLGCSQATILKASKTGKFVSKRVNRVAPYSHLSEETKKKISISRKKYLQEHPEKVPYRLNHYTKESWLEKTLNQAMYDNNIYGYIREYQTGLYSYDFAFLEVKLDIEVDGQTHEQDKVIEIDKQRDEWTKSNGWHILRFSWHDIRYDLDNVVLIIKNKLKDLGYILHDVDIPKAAPLKPSRKKEYKCPVCNRSISKQSKHCRNCHFILYRNNPTKIKKFNISSEKMKELLKTMPYTEIARLYNVSNTAIKKHCCKHGLKSKWTHKCTRSESN